VAFEAEASKVAVVPDNVVPLFGISTLVVGSVVDVAGDCATSPTTRPARSTASDTRTSSQLRRDRLFF
jgi:hypothetical protein